MRSRPRDIHGRQHPVFFIDMSRRTGHMLEMRGQYGRITHLRPGYNLRARRRDRLPVFDTAGLWKYYPRRIHHPSGCRGHRRDRRTIRPVEEKTIIRTEEMPNYNCPYTNCQWWNICDIYYPYCKQFQTPEDCEINGGYWYDYSCHGNPPQQ
jgi:hypothetical protein